MAKAGRNAPCPCGSGQKYKKCCAQKNDTMSVIPVRLPEDFDPTKIQAVHLDPENKKIFVFSKDILINQLIRDAEKIASSFDELTSKNIGQISAFIAESSGVVFPQIIKYQLEDNSLKPTCARLLSYAIETYISSVHVARGGYRRQYGILARSVIEALAITLQIHARPHLLEAFHKDKLPSSKAITFAKQILPPFGQLYGHLSNCFVHIGGFHTQFSPLNNYTKDEDALSYILSNMHLNAWLIYVVTELVFHSFVGNPRYWKQIAEITAGQLYTFNPSDQEMTWMNDFLRKNMAID